MNNLNKLTEISQKRISKVVESRILLLKKELDKGINLSTACKNINISREKGLWIVNTYDIKVQDYHTYKINELYFENIDTEKKAYILGFILGDGSIETYKSNSIRLCINNSIDDLEVLTVIRDEIIPDLKLKERNVQSLDVKNRKSQINIKIGSTILCNILINKYNIKPKKTLDDKFHFNFSLIPQELQHHFIRGFFDADGCVSCIEKNNSITFDFSFVFNSPLFCNQIANGFVEEFNIEAKVYEYQGKTCKYWSLRFNYNQNKYIKMKLIYDFLYKDSTIHLTRKKEKFEKYFEYRANSSSKQWRVV